MASIDFDKIPANMSAADILALMNSQTARQASGPIGTGITQGWTGNTLNLGTPISGSRDTSAIIPNNAFSAMNMGIVGAGAPSYQNPVGQLPGAPQAAPTQPYYATGNPNVAKVTQPTGASNSDAFFASAKAPIQTRTITSANPTYVNANTSGGGANSAALGAIFQSLIGGSNAANAANEARYAEANKTLDTFGKGQKNEIEGAYRQDVAQQEQDAISRGLGNSTIRSSLLQGARGRQQTASLNLADRLAAAKVGLLQSKSDNAADPLALAQLAAQASQYGGNALGAIAAALGINNKK